MNFDSDTNVVDVAIRRLRAKVDDPYPLKLIHTVRGIGYLPGRRSHEAAASLSLAPGADLRAGLRGGARRHRLLPVPARWSASWPSATTRRCSVA